VPVQLQLRRRDKAHCRSHKPCRRSHHITDDGHSWVSVWVMFKFNWFSCVPFKLLCYNPCVATDTKFERINYYFKSKILQNNKGTLAIPTLHKLVVSEIMLIFSVILFIIFSNFFARRTTPLSFRMKVYYPEQITG
jgi:hypothetical protein